ncbi:MAG: 2Fe-2S iron-sulfur cluster binding domain-containing protein [Oscillochloris sp.]|nr:2Fe-2S iron-sulfur cluster binding domain-containing protein [Oscillochloris sp.]
MWNTYFQPADLPTALTLLAAYPTARIVAGGTDVLADLDSGEHSTKTLLDISRITELRYVEQRGNLIAIGALATHNMIITSAACVAGALPLAQACLEVGAPQIRSRGTLGGNLVAATAANDTIAPLLALGAELTLVSTYGERSLSLSAFFLGERRTALRAGEIVREIRVPLLGERQRGIFLKLGLRQAQESALASVAVVIAQADDAPDAPLTAARIALGYVAPTVVPASAAEQFICGKPLNAFTCGEASWLAAAAVDSFDRRRVATAHQREAIATLTYDALSLLARGGERDGWPERPVLLETVGATLAGSTGIDPLGSVQSRVNKRPVTLSAHKTLLDALREDVGLIAMRAPCREGACGACTVWLNGQAVLACLVPAAQARDAEVITFEGLSGDTASDEDLHPLQAALIVSGALQCGACTPGMVMAGAKLLEEMDDPSAAEIQAALSGNTCRCAGQRKLLMAVQAAREIKRDNGE